MLTTRVSTQSVDFVPKRLSPYSPSSPGRLTRIQARRGMACLHEDPNSDFVKIGHFLGRSAVVWRKDLLVFFTIFELGPYLESLGNGLPSESIRCGVKAFFHPNN